MERRRDYRLGLEYELTLTDERDGKVWSGLLTADVSAAGLAFKCGKPHCFAIGERFEVRLLAQVGRRPRDESMVLSTRATLIRAEECAGAVAFDTPLKY